TAIEQVWDNAVAQAEQALSDAQDALAQAQAAADAANEAVSIAQANATTASQAAAAASTQAAQAASDASFAAAFEINAQGAAQTRVDNFLDDLVAEVGAALTTAKAQAAAASQQAALATAAAAEATLDAAAATDAADAAAAAAQAALNALLQVAADLNLPLGAQTAQAVIDAINNAADAAAALDDLASSIVTTDTLRTVQNAADTAQLAAVASIKAAAASAQQAVTAANAALQVAQSQAAVASAGEAERDAARADAAEAALAQAKADAQAAADQANAEAKEAASAQAAAQTRVSDVQAVVEAATAARAAATTAQQAATDALTSLTQAQTALATAQAEAADAQTAFNNSAAAQTIDPAAFQAVKQANDRAQAALQDALDAVAAAQAAQSSASAAATAADTAADTAEAAAATVNLAAAQAALTTATAAATAALTAANTAAAEAAEAAARTSPGGAAADIQAVADLAAADAAAAEAAAATAETQADIATAALAVIPRAASARTTAQAAADEAQSAAATAGGVAQTDTVTLDGTIENGDVYRVTVDGDVVSVTVGTDTADASTGITIADVRDALIQAINTPANGATDSVVASVGSGDGLITLTAVAAGVGFTATASATNNGALDDQSATATTVTGNLGGATQVAQLDTITLQGTVQGGDTYSVTVNGTVISLVIPSDNSITTLTQVRDALVTAINGSAAGAAVTADAGDTAEQLTITADVAGVAFTATATATDGGGNADNAAQSVTTTANLRGADDLADQAATDAQAAASTATAQAAAAESAAQTAVASIAAKEANDDAVDAANDAADQAAIAKQAASDAALYARTAKAVGDAVGTALNVANPTDSDLLDAIQAQLETTQVTRVTLAGTVEAGDTFTIAVGATQATFTVTTQTSLTEVRDAFIQQLTTAGTFNGVVTVEQGSTADSIRLTGATPGVSFTTTASATNAVNGTNDQAARVQRQVNADQVTQQDTVTVDGATTVADGDSFSIEIAGTTVTVSTAGGEINVGDGATAVRDALVTAIQTAITGGTITGLAVAAGGAGQLVLTATAAGAAGGFLTVVPGANAADLSVDAISNGSVADNAAQNADDANTAAQTALTAANQAGADAAAALTAAQAAANLPGAGSVAQAFLTDTQSQVSATSTSIASAVRDAAAAAQSLASAQAQADLAGANVGAIAAAIEAANSAAVEAADRDAETAANAAESALSQAETSGTAALTQAQSAIADGADLLQLATSFDQVTLTGTPAAGDQFTLTIDPTPGDAGNGDAVTVTVTAADGDTVNDVRDALVDAVNNSAGLQDIAVASASNGDGGLIVAAATSGTSIGVSVTEDGAATGVESASSQILAALTAASAAKAVIDGLFAGEELPNDAGTQTATALDNVVAALDAAIAVTRQTVSVTLGGSLEIGDTLSVTVDGTTVNVTVGAGTGGLTTLAAARNALVTALNDNVTIAGKVTAAAAFQDGELILLSDDPTSAFIPVSSAATNFDSDALAPTLSTARTGTESALRALRNGLDQASTIAETIQEAVTQASEAATFARFAASGGTFDPDNNPATDNSVDFLTGLDPTNAADTITAANTIELALTGANTTTFDFVSAAQFLADIAESFVPDALKGAATANAQATIAQQAAFQAASGLSQFEQAIEKARNEAELRAQQEARDAVPIAGDDTATTDEDTAITFDLLGNDTRTDGDALTSATIASVGQPTNGKVTIVPQVDKVTISGTPDSGDQVRIAVNGQTFTFTVSSQSTADEVRDAFITQINNTLGASTVLRASAGSGTGEILLTAAVAGQPLSTSSSTPTDANGSLTVTDTTVTGNGLVRYTPNANFNGTETFTYTVSNGATPPAFDTATVTVQVTAVNDNPDAKDDFATTSGDSATVSKTAAAGLLSNDTDIDTGDSLTIIKVGGSAGNVGNAIPVTLTLPDNTTAQALVTITADGSFTVNPNGQFEALAAGQSATGTLTYTVSDGHAGTDDQTIALIPTQANVAAVNQVSAVTIAGTPDTGDVFSISINGNPFTFTVGAQSTLAGVRNAFINAINANSTLNGIVSASAGAPDGDIKLTAKAAGGAFTIDSVNFTDNGAASGLGISHAVTTAAVAPVAQVSTYTVGGTVERGDVFEITVNGTKISHTVATETTAAQVRDALIAKLNGNSVVAGKVTASAGTGGEVVVTSKIAGQAFTTSAQAINAGTDVATLAVTITGSNDAPVADAGTASGDEDTTITGTVTAIDPDAGDSKTFSLAPGGQAANGTVTVNPDGTFSYVPKANFNGTDSFTFRVVDAAGLSSTAKVTLTVNSVNDNPVTLPDSATTDTSTPVTISVRTNDSDVEDAREALTVAIETTPAFGTVSVNSSTGIITYTPDAANQAVIDIPDGQTLTDTFTYRLTDTNGGFTIETVTVTISGANDAPVTQADSVNVDENAAVTFDPLANDVDPDGDTLSLNGNPPTPTHGTVAFNADNTITYTTNNSTAVNALAVGQTLTDSFTYTVSDGNGSLVQETVTVTINGVNDAPDAVNDTRATRADRTNVVIDVLANDTDVDSDDSASTFTITSASSALGGTVTVNTGPQAQSNLLTLGGTVQNSDVYSVTIDGTTVSVTVSSQTTIAQVRDALVSAINGNATIGLVVTAEAGTADGAIVITGDAPGAPFLITAAAANGSTTADNTATVSLRNPAVGGRESLTYDPSGAGNLLALARGETIVDTVTYTIQDSHGATDTATVQVTITGVNDAPVTAADTGAAVEDGPVVQFDVLGNDTDVDNGDVLTVVNAVTTDLDPSGNPIDLIADGVIALSGLPGGPITFNPTTGAFDNLAEGETFTLNVTYTARDSDGAETTGTLTVIITGTNDAPVVDAVAEAVNENASLSFNPLIHFSDIDSDEDGSGLQLADFAPTSALGVPVTVVGGGVLTDQVTELDLTPFTFASGGSVFVSLSGSGTGSASVAPSPTDTPADVAAALVSQINSQTGTTGVSATQTGGVITLTGSGGNPFSVFADVDHDAITTTTTTLVDGNPLPGEVQAIAETQAAGGGLPEVTQVNLDAVAGGTAFAGGGTITIDIDGQPVSVAVFAGDATATIASLLVTAINTSLTGFSASNTNGTLEITTLPDVPFTVGGTFEEGGPDVLSPAPLVVANIPGTPSLIYDITSQTQFDDLAVGQTRTDFVTVTVTDTHGGTTTSQIAVTITGTNDAPVAVADTGTTDEASVLTVDAANGLLANDADVDTSDILTVSAVDGIALDVGNPVTLSNGGVITINLDGSYSFDPSGQFEDLTDGETRTETVTYTVSDGQGGTSDATLTVTVTGTNDVPVVTVVSAPAAFTEDGPAVAVDPALTVADIDSPALVSATVSISGGFTASEDVLSFTPVGSITGAYNAATGVLTLTGVGTPAEYQSVLQSVTYQNTNIGNPDTTTRTITFQVDDGAAFNNLSNVATATVNVTAVNDNPVITLSTGTATFEEAGPAVLLDTALSVTDVDSPDFDTGQVVVAITNGTPDDRLIIQNVGGISTSGASVLFNGTEIGTFTGGTSGSAPLTVTLDADATPAAVTALGQAIAFNNLKVIPDTTPRVITIDVLDGDGGSAGDTITMTVLLEGGLTRNDFNGTVDTDWFNGANWSVGTPPDLDDVAIINAPVTFNNTGLPETIAKLLINPAVTMTAAQGGLNILGSSEVDVSGTLLISGGVVQGTGSLNVKGTVELAGGALGLAGVSLAAGSFLNAVGTGSQLNSPLTTDATSTITVGGPTNTGPVDLTIAQGFTNNGNLVIDNADAAAADSAVLVAAGVLTNAGTITFADTTAGGGLRIIDGDIENLGTITLTSTNATIANAGHVFDTANGTIDIVGTNALTIAGGTTVIGTNTVLTDNTSGTIAFTGAATLALESDAGIVSTDPTIDFGGPSDAVTVTSTDLTSHNFGIDAGATLTLTGNDQFTGTVNLGVAGTLAVKGLGNQILGGLAIDPTSGALSLVADDTAGDTDLAIAQGFINQRTITLDNAGAAAHGVTLSVAGTGLVNLGTLTVSDTGGGGGNRFIFGAIDNENGAIVLQTDATVANSGSEFENNGGTINVGTSTLTVNGGGFILGAGSVLLGSGQIDLTGSVGLKIDTAFTLAATAPDLTLSGTVAIGSDTATPASLTIADGKTLTLSGDSVDALVTLVVNGVLNVDGAGTAVAGDITVNGPNGAFAAAAGATATITGAIQNVGGHITVGAGATLIVDGASITNSGIIDGTGTIQLVNGATISGDGAIDVAGSGTGTLTINGDVGDAAISAFDDTTVVIDINSSVDKDLLTVNTIDLTDAGDTLELNFGPTFDPSVDGQTFTIINYASHAGAANVFDTVIHNLGPEFSVTVDYGSGTADAISVTVNRNPVAGADTGATDEDTVLTVDAVNGVLANDTDADIATGLSVTAVNGAPGAVGVATPLPSGALLTLSADGSYIYDPRGAPSFDALGEGASTTDSFSYEVSDGVGGTATGTVTLTITGVNDAPVVTAIAGPVAFTEDAPAVVIDGSLTVSDIDSPTLAGATITISGGFVATEDVLDFTAVGNITGTYNPATGVLTLTGADTVANYEAALRAVTYQNTNTGNPDVTPRTVSFQVDDGAAAGNLSNVATATVTVTAVNDAPVAVADTAITDEDTVFTATVPGVLGNDTDVDTPAASLTVTALNNNPGAVGAATLLPSGALLTLNANGSYTYDPNGAFETLAQGATATDSFTYEVSDGAGGTATETVTITINGVNDAPVAVADTGTTDEDSVLTVTAANGVLANDTDIDTPAANLVVSAVNGVPGNVGVATALDSGALLTLNADGSYSYDPNGAFENLGEGAPTTDSFTYEVSDGLGGTATETVTLTITGVNDAPVVTVNAGPATFTEDGPGVVVDGALTVADIDSPNLAGATVSITGGFQTSEDVLNFTDTPNITGSYDAATGILTLSGTDSVANYEAALRSVTYQNTNTGNPDITARTISFQVDDGAAASNLSNVATVTVNVTPVNDAPVVLGATDNLRAVQFDGIDDFVRVLDPTTLLPTVANEPFTVEAWIQVPANTVSSPLMSIGANAGLTGLELGIGAGDNFTATTADGTVTATSAAAVNDGGWHHVAISYDGTSLHTYVDGQLSGTAVPVALDLTAGDIVFGQSLDGLSHFKGAVDDIRFWSDARTADEIADNYQRADLPPDPNLEARYTLDNPDFDAVDNDPSLIDVTGNGHELDAGGPPSDRFNDYLVLDGVNDYVNYSQINPINGTGNITIAAWIRPDDLTGTQTIAAIGDPTTGVQFQLNGNGLRLASDTAAAGGAGLSLTAGEWNHVAVSYNSATGTVEYFVNGVSLGGDGAGTSTITGATSLAIGANNGDGTLTTTPTDIFGGDIAQVRIYDTLLDATAVTQSMNDAHFDGQTPSNLVNEFPLDGFLGNGVFNFDQPPLAQGTLENGAAFSDDTPTLIGPNILAGGVQFIGDASNLGAGFGANITGSLAAGTITNQVTVEINVKFDDLTGQQNFLDFRDTNDGSRFVLFKDPTTHEIKVFVGNNAGGNTQSFGTGVIAQDGLWTHFALTFDGTLARVFADGEEVASAALTNFDFNPSFATSVSVGSDGGLGSPLIGTVSDVRVWNVAREGFEIDDNYDAPVPSDSNGLVINYPLSDGADGQVVTSVTNVVDGTTATITGNDGTAVTFVNTAPDIFGGVATPIIAQEDTLLRGRIEAADFEGDALTFTAAVDAPTTAGGTVTINADGTYEYTPAANYNGPDSFQVTVTDAGTPPQPTTQTITIDVQPVNDAPVAAADTGATNEDTILSVNAITGVLANDTDVDTGDVLTVTALNGDPGAVGVATLLPSGALLTLNTDGSYTYDPNGAFEFLAQGATAPDTFTYE
ncbi:MAG: hypothetical protein COW30_00110, partial [Rhodospirillales bacterium CG15_BIG_FIL_POST_REV_8_21_14_020_66_15]